MKDKVKEYLVLSNEDKKKLWGKAVFVFDTNIYLSCYRYSKSTTDELLKAIKKLKGNIWMPYSIAQEFMKNRPNVIYSTLQSFEKFENDCKKLIDDCKKLTKLKDDDINIVNLEKHLINDVEKIKDSCDLCQELNEDKILNQILALYRGKVGECFAKDDLDKLKKEGKERYENKTPPGYMDAQKDNGNQYGDFIIWKEIIAYAKNNKKDIIFVTDDKKEDWWWITGGRTIGPHYLLKKEFYEETSCEFNMYNLSRFLQESNSNSLAIEEVFDNTNKEYYDYLDLMLNEDIEPKNLKVEYRDKLRMKIERLYRQLKKIERDIIMLEKEKYHCKNDNLKSIYDMEMMNQRKKATIIENEILVLKDMISKENRKIHFNDDDIYDIDE